MKISVIIPSFKPQEYIWECLDSLRVQTFPREDFEVIVILNGCCEPWKSQIELFISAKMDGMNVKLIQTDASGVSNARNIGIESSIGDYIAFIDDDDYVSPQYLEELYSLTSDRILALSYQLAFKDGENKYFPYYITRQYEKYSTKKNLPFYKARRLFNRPTYKLISRKIIGNKRFDTSFSNGEDSLFMFLISDGFKYVTFTTKNAVYYRRYREGSAIRLRGNRIKKAKNSLRLIAKYMIIYIHHPFKYNLVFLLSRIMASLKVIR